MKKFLIILPLLIIFLASPVLAANDEEESDDAVNGLMKYSNTFDNPFAGQKQISDEDFQKTLEQVKAKKKKKGKQPKKIKGNSNNDTNETDHIQETGEKNLILNIPIDLINGDQTIIPTGHYKIISEKDGDKLFLNFYQASSLIAKVPAIETNHDFDEKDINFVKIIPYDDKKIKIIFGSIDLNAYSFIFIKQQPLQ